MRFVEISAPTLEEARKAAAFQLGVSEEDVEIEVLGQPRKLLGLIGSGQYKVRATCEEPPSGDVVVGEVEGEAPAAAGIEPPEPQVITEVGAPVQPPAPPLQEPDHPAQAVAERAQQLTEQITALMGIESQVNITEIEDDQVKLSIDGGENTGLLIGQYGGTLDALQLVVAIGANKGIRQGCRVILDTAEGYRESHEEQLRRQACEAAQEAKETGREVVIPDLKGYERRIIHMELCEDPDVETYSEGDERDRRLVVTPVNHE